MCRDVIADFFIDPRRVRQRENGAKIRLPCGSDRVRCGSDRVRCGTDCSASACCTAGPSSNLGSATLEEALYRADAMRITRVVLYE